MASLRIHISSRHDVAAALRLLPAILSVAGGAAFGADSPEGLELFEKRIRPTLLAECVECHGAEKHKGGLRVDSREPLRKGGDSGPAVVPGKPADSLLLTSIQHTDPDLKMPSKAPKLADDVIRDFQRWIELGAPDPRDQPPAPGEAAHAVWEQKFNERKQWWCFQPVRKVEPPQPKDASWSAHPVDRFLLAKMEERDLTPARDADARTLYRRLNYTLTGLPPTPAESASFERELASTPAAKPKAAEAAVDRLLASPRFGEHWARHWMDLMRFAETHGSEGDPEIPGAWQYRDYLIRAFNDDVRIDQLIREHMAGDLLPNPRWNAETQVNESAIGTAHLRLVEHGFQPVDTRDEQIKTLDSQIDVDMKAFQALTVSCARCHDHKFDPISQRDYYALQGVYANCRPAMVTIDKPERLTAHRDELMALKARLKGALAEAWKAEAARFPERLAQVDSARVREQELRKKVTQLEQQIGALDIAAHQRLSAKRGTANLPAQPLSRWSFDTGTQDSIGTLNGELVGGALIRDGKLILNGAGSYFRTGAVTRTLREKTLEAWVSPANLDQRAGGVIGVENSIGTVFDTIVFAEREARRWMAGSNNSRRTQSVSGPEETAKPGEFVHLAIVWGADKSIAIYRNGRPYGTAYQHRDDKVAEFAAGDAHVLLGLRHLPTAKTNGCFAGVIDEARLYDRALGAAELAASYGAGPNAGVVRADDLKRMMTATELEERTKLEAALTAAKRELATATAGVLASWTKAVDAAKADEESPLHPRVKMKPEARAEAAKSAAKFQYMWSPATADGAAQWFRHGTGLLGGATRTGEFAISTVGDRVLTGLFPAGFQTHALSTKHNGILQSPRFRVDTDYISVRAAGRGGAQVRLICDGYPLGSNGGLFPRSVLNNDQPQWIKMDVTYRKGVWAYLEFATREDLTRIYDKKGSTTEPSWFSVDAVVFHNENSTPPEPVAVDAGVDASQLATSTTKAIEQWQADQASESDRLLLDALVTRNLLPTRAADLAQGEALLAQYRRIEATIIEPHRIPGVLETDILDAPLLPRGDHLKPGELVPRAYLSVMNSHAFAQRDAWSRSGRLELARAITDPRNPLTARVMVNRVWHWIFGRGLVATPDNFGRMGEKPTHPELLDYLAARFSAPEKDGGFGWSLKKLVRFLATTRAFALASEPSARAAEVDAGNELLSHARVRRLTAEPIRDTLLSLAGQLQHRMFGTGDNALARPQDQLRRSVYLTIRRNTLSPFLSVFDSPKPFGTTGRRDETNVPAQSLTLLNDPLVIHCASRWADREIASEPDPKAGIRRMITEAFGRAPLPAEAHAADAFLDSLAQDLSLKPEQRASNPELWRDFAHSLINAKEFIYLR